MRSDESLDPQPANSAQTAGSETAYLAVSPLAATRKIRWCRNVVERAFGSEKFRFLVIGGINTVFGYGVFAVLEIAVGDHIGYLINLFVSYLLGTVLAFVLHRRYTFRATGTGNFTIDFFRFASVYVVSLVMNVIALPLLVEVAGLSPLVGQALVIIVTTLISYFGHKYFSFRRSNTQAPPSPAVVKLNEPTQP